MFVCLSLRGEGREGTMPQSASGRTVYGEMLRTLQPQETKAGVAKKVGYLLKTIQDTDNPISIHVCEN